MPGTLPGSHPSGVRRLPRERGACLFSPLVAAIKQAPRIGAPLAFPRKRSPAPAVLFAARAPRLFSKPPQARRLACDARLVRLIDGPAGQARQAPVPGTTAQAVRQRTCASHAHTQALRKSIRFLRLGRPLRPMGNS